MVVGSTGQLARSLALAAADHPTLNLVAMGRPSLDLLDRGLLVSALKLARPTIVINAAAYTAVDRAENEQEQASAINCEGAGALAEVTMRFEIPLIHISTDYVFDGRKTGAYLETDAPNPQTVYGRSKLAGEERVAAANPRHLILRTSWVYSAFGSNFVKTMLRLAGERTELRVVADQYGNPTHAGDLASAILQAASQLARKGADGDVWGLYHVAGQGHTTWHGFAQAIVAAAVRYGGKQIPVRAIGTADFPTPAQRPANSRLNCDKFTKVFGLRLPPWTDGVDRCVRQLCAGHA